MAMDFEPSIQKFANFVWNGRYHKYKNRIESNQSDVNASMNKNIIFKLSMFNVFLDRTTTAAATAATATKYRHVEPKHAVIRSRFLSFLVSYRLTL